MSRDDFLLAPLPNHLFQRDNSAWIYDGRRINPMAQAGPAAGDRPLPRPIYNFHPMFADAGLRRLATATTTLSHQPATIEGGDIHVIGNGAVLIGMGERTTPQGVEILARALFAQRTAPRRSSPSSCPSARAFMHLDTVMTMVDRDTFVVYPYLPATLALLTRSTAGGADDRTSSRSTPTTDLFAAIADALGLDKVRVLTTDEDVRAAEREQWDDGNNFLAVAPGVVVGYERNITTNTLPAQATASRSSPIAGSELGRGRGGPRCMTCPIERDARSARPSTSSEHASTCATAASSRSSTSRRRSGSFLLDLAADLKARQVRRHRVAAAGAARTSR